MQPTDFESSNMTYKGDGGLVADLPCRRHVQHWEDDTNRLIISSVWKLSTREREMVAMGANIELEIVGQEPIPPVALHVTHEGMGQ